MDDVRRYFKVKAPLKSSPASNGPGISSEHSTWPALHANKFMDEGDLDEDGEEPRFSDSHFSRIFDPTRNDANSSASARSVFKRAAASSKNAELDFSGSEVEGKSTKSNRTQKSPPPFQEFVFRKNDANGELSENGGASDPRTSTTRDISRVQPKRLLGLKLKTEFKAPWQTRSMQDKLGTTNLCTSDEIRNIKWKETSDDANFVGSNGLKRKRDRSGISPTKEFGCESAAAAIPPAHKQFKSNRWNETEKKVGFESPGSVNHPCPLNDSCELDVKPLRRRRRLVKLTNIESPSNGFKSSSCSGGQKIEKAVKEEEEENVVVVHNDDDDDDDGEQMQLGSERIENEDWKLDSSDNEDEDEYTGEKRMRKASRKGRRDTTMESEDDPINFALRNCETISRKLKNELRFQTKSGDKFENFSGLNETEQFYDEVDESAAKLISHEDVRLACNAGAKSQPASSGLLLKPYQLVGVNFLMLLRRLGVGGAILADEMGLGKTVQAITFLALLSLERSKTRKLDNNPGPPLPHLVVCPASVLDNWEREVAQWCPSFRVLLYHGSNRMDARKRFKRKLNSNAAPFDVLLTCYSLFERDSEQQREDRKFLRLWEYDCLIMDEAHLLKDRNASRTKRLRSVSQNSRFRLMLTGTPLQNDLQELWSLLEFLMPSIFNCQGMDVSTYLTKKIKTEKIQNQNPENDKMSRTNSNLNSYSNLIPQMKNILSPFVLRRMKSQVMQQLSPKIQRVEILEMTSEQSRIYKNSIELYRTMAKSSGKTLVQIEGEKIKSDEKSMKTKNSNGNGLSAIWSHKRIASIFTELRKISNHPLLVRNAYDDKKCAEISKLCHKRHIFGNECTLQRVQEEIQSYSDYEIHQLCNTHDGSLLKFVLNQEVFFQSGKCKFLQSLLPKLESEGHRVLLFSQWTSMLDILEWVLKIMNLRFVRLDGSTEVKERQVLVDEFNTDKCIFAFLLSTRAGGQGLNLTGADTVIIHDLDFNPQMDRQAEDRCHRIGQTQAVTVYRLVTANTVDEGILKIAEGKLHLDNAILGDEEGKGKTEPTSTSETLTMSMILSSILSL